MSSMHAKFPALLLLAALLWPGTSIAADKAGLVSGEQVVRILQNAGYKAKLETDKDGDPAIQTKMSGVTVFVHFYDCKQGRCGSLQLSVGLDLEDGTTLAAVNKFNADYRYARAYLDDEKDPFLQFDFEVLHANHAEHIVSQIDMWEDLLGEFLQATGYRGDGEATPDADERAPARPVQTVQRT